MASFRGHLAFSTLLGAGYTGLALGQGMDWGPAVLGGGLTMLGGMLPDLDSDSGVPVRELFGLSAALVPLLLAPRLHADGLTPERMLVIMAGLYLAIRYPLAWLFKRYTVHRGMFHSIPGMAIAGLCVYLLYHGPSFLVRMYLAGGVMLGFLSHLVLDELYAVDLMGVRIRLNRFAGSALKLASKSWLATGLTYLILGGLVYLALLDGTRQPEPRLLTTEAQTAQREKDS
jgi:hypothetical protein